MNVSTLRWVDRWLGVPLCALLSLCRRWTERRPRAEGPPRRILFVKLAEQGSTVLAYSALHRAVERVGAENVYFLVFEPNRFVLDAMAVIPESNIIPIRTESLIGCLLSSIGAVRRLRDLKLDAAIDLEFFARSSAIFTFLSGARLRVGLHAFAGDGPWRGDLMTHRLHYSPHLHTSQLFFVQVEALEQPPQRLPALDLAPPRLDTLSLPRFAADPSEVEEMESLLRGVAGSTEVPPLVLLNANCSDLLPLRRWDDSNYVALARHLLSADPALLLAFTGAPEEAPAVEQLVSQIDDKRCISLAGQTTLRQLLVVYGLAEVMVTNDSGPAHFATLTPIDVVVLFGPETPRLFGSPSARSHLLWAKTACSPCVNAYNNRLSTCTDNVCMRRISVDAVFAKVREVLASRAGRSDEASAAR